jgi:hypothetical protein
VSIFHYLCYSYLSTPLLVGLHWSADPTGAAGGWAVEAPIAASTGWEPSYRFFRDTALALIQGTHL